MISTDDLHVEVVPITDVRPYPKNARQGDVGAIVESLRIHGQYKPVLVQRSTSFIIAGNHTYKAALELGWTEIAVTYLDVDDDEAKRILLVDNRTNDLATYNNQTLSQLLQSLPDLEGTGFDGDDLDDLIHMLNDSNRLGIGHEPDRIPDPPAETVTQMGDVWQIGKHKVMCGDSTDRETIDHLFAGAYAPLTVTSPPYPGAGMWNNDDEDGLADNIVRVEQLNKDVLDICCDLSEMICWNIADMPIGKGRIKFNSMQVMQWCEEKDIICRPIIWVKGSTHLPPLPWIYRPTIQSISHEYIYQIVTRPRKARESKIELDEDERHWHSVSAWQIGTESAKQLGHIAPFPVELAARCIRLFSMPRDIVFDPFMGAGTTIIAAQQHNRIGYGMEYEPQYVDLICKRVQEFTGDVPMNLTTGEDHDFTADVSTELEEVTA